MSLGFKNADILLPGENVDLGLWSVVACDQYTSEPEYWNKVESMIGDAPSTYHMILPEVYLESDDVNERLEKIKESMKAYLARDIFKEYKNAMIYLERTDGSGKVRQGIIGAIDLEEYDFHKGSTSLVRATEATVTSRIPPRIKVRKSAEVELPHIMILIDDKNKTVIEPMAEKELEVVYDFDLMMGGGHLLGKLLKEEEQKEITQALAELGSKSVFCEKYGFDPENYNENDILLYAMGDGNHSLATAKEFYEQLKASDPDKDFSDHPARYALAEIVNLHSPALEFEAIHRIVTEIDKDILMNEMTEALGLIPADSSEDKAEGSFANQESVIDSANVSQKFSLVSDGRTEEYLITRPSSKLTVGSLQSFLDSYLEAHGGKIDYIHGIDVVNNLAQGEHSVGFLLPDMGKEELFPTVIADGALPRKTFSMGHAEDKRFYMECRKITE